MFSASCSRGAFHPEVSFWFEAGTVPDINANSTDLRRSLGGSQHWYVLPKRMIHRLREMRVIIDEEYLERHDDRGQPLEVVVRPYRQVCITSLLEIQCWKNSRLILHAVVGGPQQFYDPTREVLQYATDTLNATAKEDRIRDLARRKRSNRNPSHVIDIYVKREEERFRWNFSKTQSVRI
jgi:hypothetical protein